MKARRASLMATGALLILNLVSPIHANPQGQAANNTSKDAKSAPKGAKDTHSPFAVYTEDKKYKNHFIPSGWMGDYNDIKFNDKSTTAAHDGRTCIKISYTAQETQGAGWAGIFWQNPANNWGVRDGGYDL